MRFSVSDATRIPYCEVPRVSNAYVRDMPASAATKVLTVSFEGCTLKGHRKSHGKDLGSKGWHNGESARLPPMWPGFKSWRRRYMWVEFVVGSLLCSETFFSGYSGFPLSSKPNISKFQFGQESGRRRTTLWMCYLQIIIYLLIYLIYLFTC